MKANELMIGDWVMDTFFDHNVPRRVEIIEPYRVWLEGNNMYQPKTTIEPIPLTPEILEKNGFKVYEQDFTSNTVYEFGSLDYMEFQEYQKYFNIGNKVTYRRFGREITYIHSLMRIYFVHQLQHALRLCGIEKDIEL